MRHLYPTRKDKAWIYIVSHCQSQVKRVSVVAQCSDRAQRILEHRLWDVYMGSSSPSMTCNTEQIEIAKCLFVSNKFMPALNHSLTKTITCIVKAFILVKTLNELLNITNHNDLRPLHSCYRYPLSPTSRECLSPQPCLRQIYHKPSS